MNSANSYHKKHTRTVMMFMITTLVIQQLILKFYQLKTKMPAGPRNAYITTKILIAVLAVEMVVLHGKVPFETGLEPLSVISNETAFGSLVSISP